MNCVKVIFLLVTCASVAIAKESCGVFVIPNSPFSVLGNSPFYEKSTNSLLYTDIEKPAVIRYDLTSNTFYEATIDNADTIPIIFPLVDSLDMFGIAIGGRLATIYWDGVSSKATVTRILVDVSGGTKQIFNDGKADPHGRIIAGTLRDSDNINCDDLPYVANASLYSYSQSEGVARLFQDVYISNGLAFDPNNNIFYYVGACQLNIKAFDYDLITGNIYNERIIIDFRINGQYPGFVATGMTIDTDGFLWVTAYGAYTILKIDPGEGKIVRQYSLPVRSVLSLTFGGRNMDTLFVTTGNNATDIRYEYDVIGNNPPSPYGGQLFAITCTGSRGYYPDRADVPLTTPLLHRQFSDIFVS